MEREHLEKAIAKDRFFAPAYSGLAAAEMRRGNYARVHELCEKALAVNAYDPLANYVDGYAYFVEGDQVTARDRLGIASQQPQYRAPALALIARGYLREGDSKAAADAARKALKANDTILDALLAIAIAMRGEDASTRQKFLKNVLSRVPLYHPFRYELYLAGGVKDFAGFIKCELPSWTCTELGCWYAETGCTDDARRFFELAGDDLIAKIWLGDLEGAKKLKVGGVFPFRRETLPALRWAVKAHGGWKFRYHLSVALASFHLDAEADSLLESCGDEPDESVFYQFRAGRRKGSAALSDLCRAKVLGDDWRIGRRLAEHYAAQNDFAKVLEVTTEYLKTWPKVDPIRLAHANALLRLGRHRECMDYLGTVRLLPSEHRGNAAEIWHECQKALGLPLTWPENLGKGEPFPETETTTN
jgi:tetratricopeptide (TPR) repeat protein